MRTTLAAALVLGLAATGHSDPPGAVPLTPYLPPPTIMADVDVEAAVELGQVHEDLDHASSDNGGVSKTITAQDGLGKATAKDTSHAFAWGNGCEAYHTAHADATCAPGGNAESATEGCGTPWWYFWLWQSGAYAQATFQHHETATTEGTKTGYVEIRFSGSASHAGRGSGYQYTKGVAKDAEGNEAWLAATRASDGAGRAVQERTSLYGTLFDRYFSQYDYPPQPLPLGERSSYSTYFDITSSWWIVLTAISDGGAFSYASGSTASGDMRGQVDVEAWVVPK